MTISVQKLKCFKSCRRMYELKYVENLVPVAKSDALETGKKYHDYIDLYFKGEQIEPEPTKEHAMFTAFLKYVAPKLNVVETEKKIAYQIGDDYLVGIVDGMEDGCFIEHKTTGESDMAQYEYMLQWDEQILAYMLMTGFRKVKYTVIRKPTIRLKQNETMEQFYERMIQWYDDDTDNKIREFELTRSDEEIDQFQQSLEQMIAEIRRAEQDKIFYKNQCACHMYNKLCDYASVCPHYDRNQENVNFTHREEVDFFGTTENKGENNLWNF